MPGTGDRVDPYRGFNFKVELGGTIKGGFREASGLDSAQDPVEYREGADKVLTARKLPGLNKYSNISLKRGVTDDAGLWDWRKKAMDGKVERIDGSIVLMDDTGEEKARWNFVAGWPTKWTGPSFNATSNEVAIETLEIAHEGISKA
jgi:phage tail-like protein